MLLRSGPGLRSMGTLLASFIFLSVSLTLQYEQEAKGVRLRTLQSGLLIQSIRKNKNEEKSQKKPHFPPPLLEIEQKTQTPALSLRASQGLRDSTSMALLTTEVHTWLWYFPTPWPQWSNFRPHDRAPLPNWDWTCGGHLTQGDGQRNG